MKTVSLKKTLIYTIMTGYVVLLILLSCMDYYLAVEYKTRREQQRFQALSAYTKEIKSRMDTIRSTLYNLASDNSDFDALSKMTSDTDTYNNVYELGEQLETEVLLGDGLQGFYLFYGSMEVPMYRVNADNFPLGHASQIGKALHFSISPEMKENFGNWFYLTIDESVYLALSYKKENVILYGIQTLNDAHTFLEDNLGTNVQVVIEADGRVQTNTELAEKLDLPLQIQMSGDKISYTKEGYSVYGESIANTGIWVCQIIKNGLQDYITIQQALLLLLTILSFIVVIRMIIFVNRHLVYPLNQIRKEMEKIRKGISKNVPEMDIQFLELRDMLDTLQGMIEQLEKQRLITYDTYIEKQKAQLQYLQLQLKPHFYMNSLKMINALAMEGKKKEIQTVIIRLSEYMRYLLQAEKEITTIKKELDFVRNYISLQNVMQSRRILMTIEIDSGIETEEVPILILQTFVENSVKYARLDGLGEDLEIMITICSLETEEGEFLDLQVKDNGQGYPENVLIEIEKKAEAGKQHVGINNLKRRCQILYGDKAEFSFYNNDGAVSECIVPRRNKDECTVGR